MLCMHCRVLHAARGRADHEDWQELVWRKALQLDILLH